ncbi:hypothetical protein HJG60_010621 [Phyllostomus discolor]|uniref:Reverse transcriptase domain-containing protein n=1 Tax=Phyllostomus discolor TaxID=89673 RepID=A0A834EF84_9CHIR|nr:hypothetical protein HJG60_010621 [Phyllostomus discolor]
MKKTADKIEALIQKVQTHKIPGLNGFTGEFYKAFKGELTPALHRLFKKQQEDVRLPKFFYDASIILILNPDKDTTKKENLRPILLMNIYTKILNEILANCIQQYIKKIIYHEQVGFIPGMQGWYNICKSVNIIHHIKKQRQKSHDHINRFRKKFDKVQHPFMIKNTEQCGNRGSIPQHNKGYI